MQDGTIADVDRTSAQGTLTDVRPVSALITKFRVSPSLGHCLRLNIRRVECKRPGSYVAIADPLIQQQIEVTGLVKTALESLGNSENQSAIEAFNRAAVQDIAGATAAFEVRITSLDSIE